MWIQNSLRFLLLILLLVALQVLILNNINFLGYANPYFYIIFIILYPIAYKRAGLLVLAFLLGFTIDIFENTGGINAFAAVFMAYIRIYIVKLINFGRSYEQDSIRLGNFSLLQWVFYVIVMVLLHHVLVEFLEYFHFQNFGHRILRILLSAGITIVLIFLFMLLFMPRFQTEYDR
ncbi:MAG: rod shape-determining protein MreD [Weeksellaceae bacterium]|nr:rod shape-determining protein MreD [Weeksellaceae bacterium]